MNRTISHNEERKNLVIQENPEILSRQMPEDPEAIYTREFARSSRVVENPRPAVAAQTCYGHFDLSLFGICSSYMTLTG